jgi:hypothetical protein
MKKRTSFIPVVLLMASVVFARFPALADEKFYFSDIKLVLENGQEIGKVKAKQVFYIKLTYPKMFSKEEVKEKIKIEMVNQYTAHVVRERDIAGSKSRPTSSSESYTFIPGDKKLIIEEGAVLIEWTTKRGGTRTLSAGGTFGNQPIQQISYNFLVDD